MSYKIIDKNHNQIVLWQSENRSIDWISKQLMVSQRMIKLRYPCYCGANKRELNQAVYEKTPKKCTVCKNSLTYKQRKQKFCSSSCAAVFNNSSDAHADMITSIQYDKSPKKCITCEKILPYKYRHRKFCCRKCNTVVGKWRNERKVHRIAHTEFNLLSKDEKRQRIIIEQGHKCKLCKCDPIHNNMSLKFELDHISGNKKDESRENLRLVCPNCHSQTSTYKVKNTAPDKHTDAEIVAALLNNQSVYHALIALNMNPHGGNYVRVRRIIREQDLILPYLA